MHFVDLQEVTPKPASVGRSLAPPASCKTGGFATGSVVSTCGGSFCHDKLFGAIGFQSRSWLFLPSHLHLAPRFFLATGNQPLIE
jgi:hypothetical protein